MTTTVTFKSEPARDADTGCKIPYCWHVTMKLDGQDFISIDRSETSEVGFFETTRIAAFILARRAMSNLDISKDVYNALDNIRGQFEKIEWAR